MSPNTLVVLGEQDAASLADETADFGRGEDGIEEDESYPLGKEEFSSKLISTAMDWSKESSSSVMIEVVCAAGATFSDSAAASDAAAAERSMGATTAPMGARLGVWVRKRANRVWAVTIAFCLMALAWLIT
jgi:hypothetical protein